MNHDNQFYNIPQHLSCNIWTEKCMSIIPSTKELSICLNPFKTHTNSHNNTSAKESTFEESEKKCLGNIESNRTERSEVKTKTKVTFPIMLMQIISNREYERIIAWVPDGKSFIIKDKRLFVEKVLHNFLGNIKYFSFTRKLNRWGFRRLHSGKNFSIFSNEYFRRDNIKLLFKMTCSLDKSNLSSNSSDTVFSQNQREDEESELLSGHQGTTYAPSTIALLKQVHDLKMAYRFHYNASSNRGTPHRTFECLDRRLKETYISSPSISASDHILQPSVHNGLSMLTRKPFSGLIEERNLSQNALSVFERDSTTLQSNIFHQNSCGHNQIRLAHRKILEQAWRAFVLTHNMP